MIELINITSVGEEQKTLIELLTKHGLHNFTRITIKLFYERRHWDVLQKSITIEPIIKKSIVSRKHTFLK